MTIPKHILICVMKDFLVCSFRYLLYTFFGIDYLMVLTHSQVFTLPIELEKYSYTVTLSHTLLQNNNIFQLCEDSNINRDVYVPNCDCKEVLKYEWIGQLMGACLRGRENLVMTLPVFFWKKLVGERVTWENDYTTVDSTAVSRVSFIMQT